MNVLRPRHHLYHHVHYSYYVYLYVGHAGAILLESLLVTFGGCGARGRLGDLHVLDLDGLAWLRVCAPEDHAWPEARSLHSLTAIGHSKYRS